MAASRKVGAGDGDGDRSMVHLGEIDFLFRKRKSSGSSSSSVFDCLSEEEVVEILQRLPLKLATQCKSVSKNWLNLISSTHFARSYLRFHNPTSRPPQFTVIHRLCGIVGRRIFQETPSSPNSMVKLTTPTSDNNEARLQFLVSSEGWVLCSSQYLSKEIYYVVNPLTNHWISLPPIWRTSKEKPCRVGFMIRADHDSNTSTSFRVVRFKPTLTTWHKTRNSSQARKSLELDVFSSETGQWVRSTLSFSSAKRSDFNDGPNNYHAIAFRGNLHWLNVWFESDIFVYNPYDPEKYQRLSLPEGCLEPGHYCCLGTCHFQGQKQLNYLDWNKGQVRVWELKDYDKMQWGLLHRVHVSELTSFVYGTPSIYRRPESTVDWRPHEVAFHPWDRDIMLCFKHHICVQYNFRSKTVKRLLQQGRNMRLVVGSFFLLELPWWPTSFPFTTRN